MKRVLIKRPTGIKGTCMGSDCLKKGLALIGSNAVKIDIYSYAGGLGKVAPTLHEEIYVRRIFKGDAFSAPRALF